MTAQNNRAEVSDAVTYGTLREANEARRVEWDAGNQITLAYRGNEFAGEAGEVCNVIKKLERERMGIAGSRDTVEHLAEELADAVICLDLIAMTAGIDLEAAVEAKFNATSEKVGLRTRYHRASNPAVQVTKEMVERFEEAFYGRHERGFIMRPLIDPPDFRPALTAALSQSQPAPQPAGERLIGAAKEMRASLHAPAPQPDAMEKMARDILADYYRRGGNDGMAEEIVLDDWRDKSSPAEIDLVTAIANGIAKLRPVPPTKAGVEEPERLSPDAHCNWGGDIGHERTLRMKPDPDGEYVRLSDHNTIVERLEKELADLKHDIERAQSALVVGEA